MPIKKTSIKYDMIVRKTMYFFQKNILTKSTKNTEQCMVDASDKDDINK